MKALVTGATGGLGRHLITHLRRSGYDVIATGRNPVVGGKLAADGFRFEPLDIADQARLIKLTEGVNVVFHCAAMTSLRGLPKDFTRTNVFGTINVGIAAGMNGAKLVHVSSPTIYFDYRDRRGIKEDAELPVRAANMYAQTKLEAEFALQELVQDPDIKLNTVIIRPAGIFGAFDEKLMPRLIRAAQSGGVPLINGGRALVDVTYVENVVHAMLLAAQSDTVQSGTALNITNGEPVTLKAFIDRVLTSIGVIPVYRKIPYWAARSVALLMEASTLLPFIKDEPKLTRYLVGAMSFDQTLDISAAKSLIGYQPPCSLDQGIHRYAEWYRKSTYEAKS